jgi:hypothetical protein
MPVLWHWQQDAHQLQILAMHWLFSSSCQFGAHSSGFHMAQLYAPNRGLHLKHAAVGGEAFMEPTKGGRLFAIINGVPALLLRAK